jgi:hypothetical protein
MRTVSVKRASSGLGRPLGTRVPSDADAALAPKTRDSPRRVVEEYVATGQRVGSRALVERSGLQVSPSTVRSELSELETLGLLTHPHTSAGRLPTESGYRWYETANFCLEPTRADGRDLRARHNLAYWRGRDYLGVGIGAVSTVASLRRRNRPGLAAYVRALRAGERPPSEIEIIDDETRTRERLLLGLRLDEPLLVADVERALDREAAERLLASSSSRATTARTCHSHGAAAFSAEG